MGKVSVRGYVDYCLYFPASRGAGGTVYLAGWAYTFRAAGSVGRLASKVEIINRGEILASVNCDLMRPGVCQVFPDAPIDCGFENYIVVKDRARLANSLSINYLVMGKRYLIQNVPIVDVTELTKYSVLRNSLSARQMKKIENLILNEQERLEKATILRSNPVFLSIDPCFSCQLDCPDCHPNRIRKAGMKMPMLKEETLERILEKYGNTTIAIFFHLRGEPLLNKKFASFVRRAHEYEIWTATSTNLSLPLSDQRVDEIITSGLDLMILSVDGATEETYLKYRQGGDFKLVLKNMERLVQRKKALGSRTPLLRWQFLIFPWNKHEIEPARELAAQIGVDEFITPPGDVYEHVPMEMVNADIRRLSRVSPNVEANLLILEQKQKAQNKYFGCDYLYQQMAINSDGSVHPCGCLVEPRHLVGNLLDDSDLFNNNLMQANRALFHAGQGKELYAHEACAHCWMLGSKKIAKKWPNDQPEADGHIKTVLGFLQAFETVTGSPLHAFLPGDRQSEQRSFYDRVRRSIRRHLTTSTEML